MADDLDHKKRTAAIVPLRKLGDPIPPNIMKNEVYTDENPKSIKYIMRQLPSWSTKKTLDDQNFQKTIEKRLEGDQTKKFMPNLTGLTKLQK